MEKHKRKHGMANLKLLTCTTIVHLGLAIKFRVCMANGESENIGSARPNIKDINHDTHQSRLTWQKWKSLSAM